MPTHTQGWEDAETKAPAPWEARLRAGDVGLPLSVRDDQGCHAVTVSRAGIAELHWWRPNTGELIQATARPGGTTVGVMDPTGAEMWWFDDGGGDERGTWQRQAWGEPPGSHAPAAMLPPAHSTGLALGRQIAIAASMDSEYGVRVHRLDRSGTHAPALLYEHREAAVVGGLSSDDALVVVAHSERGDANHLALKVLAVDTGEVVAELDDGDHQGLDPRGFSPMPGDQRLLVMHEREAMPAVLVWDTTTGAQTPVVTPVSGEVEDVWWAGDDSVLLAVGHAARVRLVRLRLSDGQVTWISPEEGSISGAVVRAGCSVDARWSSAVEPWCIRRWHLGVPAAAVVAEQRSMPSEVVLRTPGTTPQSVPVHDIWVDGPGGPVHALLRFPAAGARHGLPLLVMLHGGPAQHDADAFHPQAAAWVDHGYAVVQVNYRGSTGYGSRWQRAHQSRLGHVELEDAVAVRDFLVERGVADQARVVLSGSSWGGFLTLLGLGSQPGKWSAGVAQLPVADYVAAYEDETETLKAFDRALFGGSPDTVLEKYLDASPLSYIDRVRAPVLIVAAERDQRCPLRQIQNYVDRLVDLDVPHELCILPAGHRNVDAEARIRVLNKAFAFLDTHLSEGG